MTAVKTAEAVTTVVATPRELNITNFPEKIAQVKRVAELKAIIKAAEAELGAVAKGKAKEKPGVEVDVIKWMADYDVAILRGVKAITRSSLRVNTSYDAEILTTAFPEAEKAARKESPYTFLSYSL